MRGGLTPATMVFVLLSLASPAAAQPAGYWLYVEGKWKAGYVTQQQCTQASAKFTARVECRPVVFAQTAETWTMRPMTDDQEFNRKTLGTYKTENECVAEERIVRARLREVFGRVFPFACVRDHR